MHRSKIPSPSRSEGAKVTPRRHRFRSSRSVSSPARSDVSAKLSSIVRMHATQSPVLSPLKTRRSVLSDNTDIEVPGRQSWWKRLEENSRDVMEVFETKTTEQPENIEEYIEANFKSQENDYTVDLPESSDGESINSIVLPQRKFFSQKQTQSNKLFNKIIQNRENLTHRKSKVNTDNTIFVGKKNFFNKDTEVRSRPGFPPELLNMTNKTIINKTQDITKHEKVRNLLGNRAGPKRKNMFADFIMSESEEEIPDIQPNVYGFAKNKQPQRKMSSLGTRNTSPRSNETDLEFEDWQHLPSSTMVDNEFENSESSPVKRPRLSKPDSVIEEVRGNVRNKLNKTKQTLIMSRGLEDDDFEESAKKKDPKNTHEKILTEIPDTDTATPFIADIIQVDSDDNNFTLRYDNDDKNMQDDEMDVTVKEFGKDNTNTNKNNINTTATNEEKVSNSQSSLKGIEPNVNKSVIVEERDATGGTKAINPEQHKNVSWKVLETYKEQHAAVPARDDLIEKDKSRNTSMMLSTNQREVDEIDNREINIESKNTTTNKEKTISKEVIKNTSITTAQGEAALIERKQNDDVLQEDIEISENRENTLNRFKAQKDINNSIGNKNEEIMDNNVKDVIELCIETHIHDNVKMVETKLNESKKDTFKDISTTEKSNKVTCAENREGHFEEHEKVDDVSPDEEINDKANDIDKETKEIAVSCTDQNLNQGDGDNGDDNNQNQVVDVHNNDTRNKSLESEREACLKGNILTDDEVSKQDDETTNKSHEEYNKMASVDENNLTEDEDNEEVNQEDDEDDAEESEIQNETNDESDNRPGVSSLDANIETDDEENPKDSDEEDNDENDAEENDEVNNELVISSINKNNETENDANNEENDSDDGISDRIGMPSMNIATDDEMNLEQERDDESNTKIDTQVTFSKGRIYLTNVTGESTHSFTEEPAEAAEEPAEAAEAAESDHEDAQTQRLALEQCLMKIKNDNIEKRRKIEEEVRNSLKTTREPFNNFKAPARPRPRIPQQRSDVQHTKTKSKKASPLLNIENLPPELLDDMKYKPPRRYQPKSAAWITNRLYKYLETKLEPKYDYKARVKAEKLVEVLYEFSREVRRQRAAAPHAVHALEAQLARAGLVTTHYDFYKFLHEFMPREIRVKVVPDVVNEIPLPRHGVFSNII